jgi:hypothetical protein
MTFTHPDDIEEDGNVSGHGPWTFLEPSTEIVQKHYVSARVHELNSDADQGREKTIDLLLTEYADEIKGKSREK